jgi:hypothetical protein
VPPELVPVPPVPDEPELVDAAPDELEVLVPVTHW